eukprot:2081611-Amphidinium_carterae.1
MPIHMDSSQLQVVPSVTAACGPVASSTVADTVPDCYPWVRAGWLPQEQYMAEAAHKSHAALEQACVCGADAAELWPEDQRSVASSTCSTAPSTHRRRRPRDTPADRRVRAEMHRQMDSWAQILLEEKEALAEQLEAGGDESLAALARMHGMFWRLATDEHGCRLVQLAIGAAKGAERAALCEELHGHVREAMGSPHANYVLQKVVE